MKHKHAELIKAWADGARIEFLTTNTGEWCELLNPRWGKDVQYRIKPEPKPDLVRYLILTTNAYCEPQTGVNAVATFDGETQKLKKVELI